MSTAIIAHRGFSSRHVENTMPAIRAALSLGVDFVEMDVHETRDGKLVVFHDYRLGRLCGVAARVCDTTMAEMKRLNPLIPSLREALLACRGRARVLVEIKRADPVKVAAMIAACGMEREVIVFALSMVRMKTLAAANPRIARFALVARRLPETLSFTAGGIGADKRLIRSMADVERIHRRGWKLFVWTVNRRADMERLIAWGVDGLITNYPDRGKSCLARR
ncbi:MAG: glycerophosphodiester phosphodiesterase [Verrucomicrobia bacterium]|nr:glycerophosphodiester phosphodiesterase [Verrucomicrobiota bacterium]